MDTWDKDDRLCDANAQLAGLSTVSQFVCEMKIFGVPLHATTSTEMITPTTKYGLT